MPGPPSGEMPPMPSLDKLIEFTAWCQQHLTGDEKGQAQIFLDRLFQAFGQPGCLDVGGWLMGQPHHESQPLQALPRAFHSWSVLVQSAQ